MRGSIVCIAIFCFSHVSGAPTVEDGKTFSKIYNSGEGELIYALIPIWQHEVVFAVCEGSSVDKKCKIFLESTNQDKNTAQSCDLNLTYSGSYHGNVVLFNAGNSRAVLAVATDGDDRIKLISISFKGCQIKETSVEVGKQPKQRPILPYSFLGVVPHEANYDLLLENGTLCNGGFCKVTYDYEGNLVKAASKLSSVFENIFAKAYANNNLAIAAGYDILMNNNRLIKIYFVKDGEDQKNIPPIANIETRDGYVALSADENKVGVCWSWEWKVVCSQFHTEGELRTVNIELPINYKLSFHRSLDLLNLEKGLLQLSVTDKNIVHVTHFDEAGKQGKSVQVDTKCKDYDVVRTKLYRNANGQYCFNSFCNSATIERNHSQFSITNSCFLNTELI